MDNYVPRNVVPVIFEALGPASSIGSQGPRAGTLLRVLLGVLEPMDSKLMVPTDFCAARNIHGPIEIGGLRGRWTISRLKQWSVRACIEQVKD